MTPRSIRRVAFDMSPASHGPGRYVTSLDRGIDRSRFDVVLPYEEAQSELSDTSAAEPGVPRESGGLTIKQSLLRVVPPFAKVWAGAYRTARAMAAQLRGQGIDLYHAQNTGCEESPIAARLAKLPIILGTFHGDPTYDYLKERDGVGHRAIERCSNRCLHHAIAVSDWTKRAWMERTGIPEARVTVIHNGVNCEQHRRKLNRAEARGLLGLPQDALLIGAVGRLDHHKGHGDLIDAMPAVLAKTPNAVCVIAGQGVLREQLENQIQRLQLGDAVRLLGFCDNVEALYDALDVLAMPSHCETIGYALLEAMAHGLPTVNSRAGGMPEVVVDGETGFLVEVEDVPNLADRLIRLLESAELRATLGDAGRRRIEQDFTEEEMIRKTVAVYDRLLEARASAKGADAAARGPLVPSATA